ncbi:MAG TPA: hypothetical protein VMZ90_07095 [Vicinamibacterales bacterium]|nr:hypothetical protein [Vicinamibacterales bacterium]
MMRKLMNVVIVALVAGPALVLGQAGDVNKVLADMRAALGGADKVAAVKTMTAVGTSARTNSSGSTTEGELELAMELPDKYVARTVIANLGTMSVYRNAGFNGTGVINEVENPPNLSGGGGTIMIRGGGPGGGATATPEQKAANDQRMLLAAKKDFARMTLGMFGSSYDAFPLQFTYAGQADAPEGKAHVIAVKGADNFDAKLFVDVKTNLPLMLSWSDKEPLVMQQNVNRGGGPGGGQTMTMSGGGGTTFTSGGGRSGGQQMTEEERAKMMADAEARMREADAARKVVEYRIYYSNFKAVNGVLLPHTMQRSIDGKPSEQTTFEQIKINPKIDKNKFTVSK